MSAAGEKLLKAVKKLDDLLAKKDQHRLSPFWMTSLTDLCESTARTGVYRVGRQGGKSTTMARIAVASALFVTHPITRGTRGVVAFVSVSRRESSERLHNIASLLDTLGVKYRRSTDEIELEALPIVFRTYAASFRTAVGFTSVLILMDECARMRDDSDGSNPAEEVYSSLVPSTVTQPNSFVFLVSSAFGDEDFHAKRVAMGSTEHQRVYIATSWDASPLISESWTHSLQPDPKKWAREFASIPQTGLSSAFERDALIASFRQRPAGSTLAEPVCVIDASSGGKDAFTFAICGYAFAPPPSPYKMQMHYCADGSPNFEGPIFGADGRPVPNDAKQSPPMLCFHQVEGVEGGFWGSITGDRIVDDIATLCRRWGVRHVWGDQREALFLEAEFNRHSLRFHSVPWTNGNKITAVDRIRRLLSQRQLVLPNHEKLKVELLSYSERITASNTLTFSARGAGHDDYASLLITAALCEQECGMPMSPLKYRRGGRYEIQGT